jgi:hypothetical protein
VQLSAGGDLVSPGEAVGATFVVAAVVLLLYMVLAVGFGV